VEARHTSFAHPLNLVVIVKTKQQTQRQAHVLLFSSDLAVPCAHLRDDDGLRCQLEFNFREAKPDWGVEDFMQTTPTAVTNAAKLAFFMVNFAERLLQDGRHHQPDWSVLDRKAHYRGSKYVEEAIKLLPEWPEPIVLARIRAKLVGLGRIHAAPADSLAA
jgi:putative transposase